MRHRAASAILRGIDIDRNGWILRVFRTEPNIMNTPLIHLMLQAAWAGMALGLLSGAGVGLFFHRDDWLGGYSGFRRRLLRLGHISWFGLAFVNLGFVLTLHATGFNGPLANAAATGILVGQAAMPAVCFLSAWRKPFRHLFFIPVLGVLTGICCTLAGLAI